MVRTYVDFSVGIEIAGSGYLVRAFTDRAEAECLTELPMGREQLGTLRPLSSGARQDRSATGRALFAALLPGPVGELYAAEWGAAMDAGNGICLRLHLRPTNRELGWLTRIPWELLFDERTGTFLCLDQRTPLVRHLDLPCPVERVPFQAPVRVLMVASDLPGLEPLDLAGERERIEAAGQGRRRFELKVLERTSPEELRRELLPGRYQIVHFMGHGLTDEADGSLLFAAADGSQRKLTGKELSHLLQGVPGARLVILNACRSAAAPIATAADPLAGVAAALVRGGQAAVLGMQLDIADSAAVTFSATLYERLAAGDRLEAAVAEARLAVYLANSGGPDWFAPVLFLRGGERRLAVEAVEETGQARDVIRHDVTLGDVRTSEDITIDGATGASARPRNIAVTVKSGDVTARSLAITGAKGN
jgi:CHAT domain